MKRHAERAFSLVFAIVLPLPLQAAEPTKPRKFPAEIRIVEAKRESGTHFAVRLSAEEGVEIYANKPQNMAWQHVAARLTIHDAEGKRVGARVTYPVGTKIETAYLGDLYVYRDSVDLLVVIDNHVFKRPLSLRLEGAGCNRLQSSCLGRMKLDAVRK